MSIAFASAFQLVGQAYAYLETIRSLLSIEKEPFPIFDTKGQKQGTGVISIDMQAGLTRSDMEGYDQGLGFTAYGLGLKVIGVSGSRSAI